MENNFYKKIKMHESIKIFEARTHGLKNVTTEIPHDKITTITGLSGSGKSSLAMDTLFAEGQRRYIESLSSYARQFLNKFEKPEFKEIIGLRPAIAIEQKTQGYNPRSTTGTVTEIYDYLRVLYSTVGTAYSPYTLEPLIASSASGITEKIYQKDFESFAILAPLANNKKGTFKFEFSKIQKTGFNKVIINDIEQDLDFIPELDKNKFHNIDIVIGNFNKTNFEKYEIENACTQALNYGNNFLKILIKDENKKETMLFSSKAICPVSGFTISEFSPRLFSFNNPVGACYSCLGLGKIYQEDSFADSYKECGACKGKRLNPQALSVKIKDKNIIELCQLPLNECKEWIENLNLENNHKIIALPIVEQIVKRIAFLINVGLDYLTLDRAAETLSGGESQRIRLASQIGSSLEGVLYVLDEPSIGLHPQDNSKLIKTLQYLRDLGNTIVIVEHDQETMENSDYIIEMGPKAGIHGGQITFEGTVEELKKTDTITSLYLNGIKKIEHEKKEITDFENIEKIIIENANLNNLKNLTVEIPLNHLVGVCGVSGSGKSTLIMEVLRKSLEDKLNDIEPELCKLSGKIINFEVIDQSAIGKTPRSTPSTYSGIMTYLREWFAKLPESKSRGYTASRFSFNVEQGRCKACKGEGSRHIQMHFMPDMQITCDSCQGKRYNAETLEIKYDGLSISDVLNLSIEEALKIFSFIPYLKNMLQTLCDVHLGYLTLGQNAITLSGGEAQRLKLAKILGTRKHEKTLYILDEPTTGLHFDDVNALLEVLRKLVKQGNSVLMIEHHVDMLKMCDWLIEIGPEGGKNGGNLIAQGSFEKLKELKTPTGKCF